MRVRSLIRKATRQDGLRIAARAGYLISGILHLLIAYTIVRIAAGGKGDADPSGAVATVATSHGGVVALWVIAIALVPLALWRLAETLVGLHPAEGSRSRQTDESKASRLKAFGLLLVYCGVAHTAVRFALGSHQSSGQQNAGLSARLMQRPWGRTILIAAGAIIVIIGAYYAYKGLSRRFQADLNGPPAGSSPPLVFPVTWLKVWSWHWQASSSSWRQSTRSLPRLLVSTPQSRPLVRRNGEGYC